MNIVQASFEVLDFVDGHKVLERLERYGRVCYKSKSSGAEQGSSEFIKKIIASGHESVIEHEKISVLIVCDRGVSHEIVRHRIASYSQESTRYCNYSKDKFGNQLTFIRPLYWDKDSEEFQIWYDTCKIVEERYLKLIELGSRPEEARSILPNSLKTEIVVTMNLREWRHFFRLRTSNNAHPQMREISITLLKRFKELVPVVFDDIEVD